MNCACGNPGKIERGSQMLCTSCFTQQCEKRVRKAISERPLEKNQRVLVIGSLADVLIKKLIHLPIIVETADQPKEGYDVVITQHTADDESAAFLDTLSGDMKFTKDNTIHLFRYVTDDEAATYAKLKDLNFTPHKKNKKWEDFLAHLRPEMKHNLVRNADELKKILT